MSSVYIPPPLLWVLKPPYANIVWSYDCTAASCSTKCILLLSLLFIIIIKRCRPIWWHTMRRGQSLLAAAATRPSIAVATITAPTAMASMVGMVTTSWIDWYSPFMRNTQTPIDSRMTPISWNEHITIGECTLTSGKYGGVLKVVCKIWGAQWVTGDQATGGHEGVVVWGWGIFEFRLVHSDVLFILFCTVNWLRCKVAKHWGEG